MPPVCPLSATSEHTHSVHQADKEVQVQLLYLQNREDQQPGRAADLSSDTAELHECVAAGLRCSACCLAGPRKGMLTCRSRRLRGAHCSRAGSCQDLRTVWAIAVAALLQAGLHSRLHFLAELARGDQATPCSQQQLSTAAASAPERRVAHCHSLLQRGGTALPVNNTSVSSARQCAAIAARSRPALQLTKS